MNCYRGAPICRSSTPPHEQSTKHRDTPSEFTGAAATPRHKRRSVKTSEGGGWMLSRRLWWRERGGGVGWPGDRWKRTRCQTGWRSTESTTEYSEVLCLLEGGELFLLKPSIKPDAVEIASRRLSFFFFYLSRDFWATGGHTHLRKTPTTTSLMCWGGNGGDLSPLWCCSAAFS